MDSATCLLLGDYKLDIFMWPDISTLATSIACILIMTAL